MATGTSSESQTSSYLNSLQQKPNIEASTQQILDEETAASIMKELTAAMIVQEGLNFQARLKTLNTLFQKGYSNLFMTHDNLMRKMMNHFTKLGKMIQDNNSEPNIESRMLFVLSVIAQLLRENQKFYYPFTRKFLLTVFTIDNELLQGSPFKSNILAILAVIYENFSRQPKLVRKYSMEEKLKYSLLSNYYLVEEIFTLKTFNKTIMNLVNKGIYFSVGELQKYKVVETVSNFISKNQLQLFMIKMRMTVLSMSGK